MNRDRLVTLGFTIRMAVFCTAVGTVVGCFAGALFVVVIQAIW